MINREHELSVVRQCELLELARSTAYYQPLPVSAADLALMRRIDEAQRESIMQHVQPDTQSSFRGWTIQRHSDQRTSK